MNIDIQVISIDRLNPAAYNPRIDLKPGDPDYEKLKKSIKEFGYVEPIIWNKRTGNVVGGHQRLKILKEEGHKEVQVSVVDLEDTREKALNIALNKISGDWNEEKLNELFLELQNDLDLDISITGFETNEIDELLSNFDVLTAEEDDFDLESELAKEEPPITKIGDVWLLGNHKLLCGDSTSKEDVSLLMDNKKADLILTDPPYNVNYESESGLKIENDNLATDDFYNLLLKAFSNMFEVSKAGTPIYVFHADTEAVAFRTSFNQAGFKLSQCLVWVKNSLIMGRQDYHWKHEPILYGWKEGAAHKWYGKRNKSTSMEEEIDFEQMSKKELIELVDDLIHGECDSSIIRFDKPQRSAIHPTMKPIGLLSRLINNSSKRNDIVVDLFGGSGSTLIACEKMERICYTMELDPKYCDAIVNRYKELNGEDGIVLIRNNKTIKYSELSQ